MPRLQVIVEYPSLVVTTVDHLGAYQIATPARRTQLPASARGRGRGGPVQSSTRGSGQPAGDSVAAELAVDLAPSSSGRGEGEVLVVDEDEDEDALVDSEPGLEDFVEAGEDIVLDEAEVEDAVEETEDAIADVVAGLSSTDSEESDSGSESEESSGSDGLVAKVDAGNE